MNNYEFLEKLGFSSNEAKVYGTLIKHKVLNGYEIAKLSGVARSLVYEVINRLVAEGAVIRRRWRAEFLQAYRRVSRPYT